MARQPRDQLSRKLAYLWDGGTRETGRVNPGLGDSVKAAAMEGCLVGAGASEEMQLLPQLP